MVPEIISFNKSAKQRLEEYQQLFETFDTPCCEITEIWTSVFEDFVVVGVNWKAMWVLSEENCKKYDTFYPTGIIVEIYEFNWKNLTAIVKVLATQDNLDLPLELEVPVIEIHPLKVQEYDITELEVFEDWLDRCRFFFKNLWYPWDAKFDVTIQEWCKSHLKNRLQLQHLLRTRAFDKKTENYIKLLLAQAKNVDPVADKSYSKEDDWLKVVRKYTWQENIKTELELIEDPDLRSGWILLKNKQLNWSEFVESTKKQEAKLVWVGGSCQSLVQCLEIAQGMVEEGVPFKVYGTLQEALDSSNTNDVILLPPGEYTMTSLRAVKYVNKSCIKGFDKLNSIVMPDLLTIQKVILFECFGYVELDNLTISKSSGVAVHIYDGTVKISNCKIMSKETNPTSKGIAVMAGSKLNIDNCEIMGFGTGVFIQGGTHVSIVNSKIIDCHEGLTVFEDTTLSMQGVEISSCFSFGIRIESSKIESKMPLVGDLNLVGKSDLACKIDSDSVTFIGNKKGDVLVKKSETFLLFEESPEDDSSDVICLEDEDGEEEEEECKDESILEVQEALNNAFH